jgi:hypothetical protein
MDGIFALERPNKTCSIYTYTYINIFSNPLKINSFLLESL